MKHISTILTIVALSILTTQTAFTQDQVEVSDDGREIVLVKPDEVGGNVTVRGAGVPFGTAPDWQNDIRRQVGGLQVADMNGDGLADVIVGCYHSQSYPPYPAWRNYIYYNTGGQIEDDPSWTSDDERSTTDIQVGDINGDTYPDIFAANGDFNMAPSVVYWGGPTGPSTTPGWLSNEPQLAWTIGSTLFDFDHDRDLDLVTANQGNSPDDPYRPIYVFRNDSGTLSTTPTWQSAEWSIQNCLAFGDYDGDGWEDLAASKWANFESGVYRNVGGTLQTTPAWTTGDDDTDKGIAWADVDGNGWLDLALGHDPTLLYTNDAGTLTQVWSSGATYFGHSELRFCDVDRDGDADLAETHFSDGKVHVYLNNAGVLDTAPTWTYDSSTVGTAIAFGDVTGDGWLDLIVGNSGDVSVKIFYNQGPACPGDLDGDNSVGLSDLATLLANYGTTAGACYYDGDLDGDNDVDLSDLAALLALYGQTCP